MAMTQSTLLDAVEADGAGDAVGVSGKGIITVQVVATGSAVAVVSIQASIDGTNFTEVDTHSFVGSAGNGMTVLSGIYEEIRAVVSGYSAGVITVKMNAARMQRS